MQLAGAGSERNRKRQCFGGLAITRTPAKSLNPPERPVPPVESLEHAGGSFCREDMFADHFSVSKALAAYGFKKPSVLVYGLCLQCDYGLRKELTAMGVTLSRGWFRETKAAG